jgi:hypothetical protein
MGAGGAPGVPVSVFEAGAHSQVGRPIVSIEFARNWFETRTVRSVIVCGGLIPWHVMCASGRRIGSVGLPVRRFSAGVRRNSTSSTPKRCVPN